jgi:cyclopropane-fatty-acyl-phospholipid synthase
MNAPQINEGRDLPLDGESRGVSRGLFSWAFGRFAAVRCNALLDQMDAGLHSGAIAGSLPDGSQRQLGGRGPGPIAEMNIRQWRALLRIGMSGSVGLYQGWAAKEWDSPDPVQIFDLFVRNRKTLGNSARASAPARLAMRVLHWMRRNSKAGSRRNIEFHYDLGNDFYTAWLDKSMTYSSALFAEPISGLEPLEAAQTSKNTALLGRLQLNAGESLLEIGCGWGGLAEQAVREYGVHYHGITLSREQKDFAEKRFADAGLNVPVEFSITDYRDVAGQYDGIASVEMVEAVGQEYWPDYLSCIARNLKPGGRAALQYISIEDDIFDAYSSGVDFIQRYIFPGGMLLSESRFRQIAEECGLVWKDQQNFGLHYAETLRRWRSQFDAAVAQGMLPASFDDKFIDLWRFYLMYCEGGFRGGGTNVAQVTLVKA